MCGSGKTYFTNYKTLNSFKIALKLKPGWIQKFQGDIEGFFSDYCNTTFKTAEEFHSCLSPLLYERNETVSDQHFLFNFNTKNKSSYNNLTFETFMTSMTYGRCYMARDIGILGETNMLKIVFNKTNKYKIWVHDPDYFLITYFPNVFPGFDISFPRQESDNVGGWSFFEATEHNLLNTASSPCRDYKTDQDKTISFTTCIGLKPINMTGCTVGSILFSLTGNCLQIKVKSYVCR